jgi:hypothetical protein
MFGVLYVLFEICNTALQVSEIRIRIVRVLSRDPDPYSFELMDLD